MAHTRPHRLARAVPSLVALLLLVLTLSASSASAASLLAIDYGTDSFKASLVKPGIPFDVLLTKEGKRKTPAVVSFRGEDRFVGGDAASLATRFPQDTIPSIKLLLAHSPSHPQSRLHSSLFNLPQSTTSRLSPTVSTSKGAWPVEEVLAYQFSYAKELAEEHANEPVRETVVTVPGWFAEAERRSVVDAAEIAGLRVVGLVNDGAAAAVNYAMARTFPPEPSYHLIYDLGSGSLRTSVVSFKSAMLPDPLSLAETPQLKNVTSITVHGYGYDLEAAGYVFDRHVRDMLVEAFEQTTGKQLEAGRKVTEDKRAMAKLLKEATRVKQVLSANTAANARIEGLIDDLDFRTEVTRADLESRAASLASRLTDPIQTALDSAKLTLDQIESVILVGGSSRVPMVQKAVADKVGEEKIAKNVNADEAAVLGAALYGAGITRGFRTKDIRVQDLTPHAIDVAYLAQPSSTDAEPRHITTHLFPAYSKTGNRKTLTMRKTEDFDLEFSYRKTGSPSDAYLPARLFNTHLKGISSATANLTTEQLANATVRVSVELDANGLVKVGQATLVLREEDESKAGILGGISDKLKGLKLENLLSKFGAGKNSTASASSTASAEGAEESPASEDAEAKEKVDLTDEEKEALEELRRQAALPPAQVKLDAEQREPQDGGAGMSLDEKADIKKRLRDAKASLQRKIAREEARNVLEAYVYRVRDLLDGGNLESEASVAASIESERKAVKELMEKTSEWLWDEGEQAETKVLKEKKKELEKLVKHISSRSTEALKRPEAITNLRDALTSSSAFLSSARTNHTAAVAADDPLRFTADELDKLDKLISSTQQWLDDSVKKQEKTKPYEDAVFKVAEVERKLRDLESEVKKLEKKKAPRRKKAVSSSSSSSAAGGEPTMERKKDEL
ncbi:hypothetical protein JCM11251_007722 [Rhodosporidiobolus azoricus]